MNPYTTALRILQVGIFARDGTAVHSQNLLAAPLQLVCTVFVSVWLAAVWSFLTVKQRTFRSCVCRCNLEIGLLVYDLNARFGFELSLWPADIVSSGYLLSHGTTIIFSCAGSLLNWDAYNVLNSLEN